MSKIISEAKKKIFIEREPRLNANIILEAIQMYTNLSLDDFPKMDTEKRNYIEAQLSLLPNPEEEKEWTAIMALKNECDEGHSDIERLKEKLSDYISNWEKSLPANNHVIEARQLQKEVDRVLNSREDEEWISVDIDNKTSLTEYLKKYPKTTHKYDIDNLFWEIISKDIVKKENSDGIDEYRVYFPEGINLDKADKLEQELTHWLNIKHTDDIFLLNKYVKMNSKGLFIEKAIIKLRNLKNQEISKMKKDPSSYEVSTMFRFLSENIFSENELINHDVVTERVLETLRNPDILEDLPDINIAIEKSKPECKEGYTDIFFFGIPSTGKTCILMGLSRSNSIHINTAHGGGEYASTLQQFIDVGLTVPQTNSGFVATLEATITDKTLDAHHKINLVEMAGEDFAKKIAGNQDQIYDFESMGTGATELLKNNNKKVFFLIIDPTTNVIKYKRKEITGYDEETGDPIYNLATIRCNQQILISKMIDLFAYKGNEEIMKKVDSIHIIITKADLLGDNIDRERNAINLFNAKYGEAVVERLAELSKEYHINAQNNFRPKLYTFSLGNFYVGGVYEYDPTDSNRLVKAIRNSTGIVKKGTFWDKVKRIFN